MTEKNSLEMRTWSGVDDDSMMTLNCSETMRCSTHLSVTLNLPDDHVVAARFHVVHNHYNVHHVRPDDVDANVYCVSTFFFVLFRFVSFSFSMSFVRSKKKNHNFSKLNHVNDQQKSLVH